MILELISSEFWRHAAIGGAAGFLLHSLFTLFREKDRLLYRIKRTRRIARGDLNAALEPEEYEGYLAHSLTQEERARFPASLLAATLGVGLLWASWQTENDLIMGLIALAGAIFGLIKVFLKDRNPVIEVPVAGPALEEDEGTETRGQALLAAAAVLLMAFFSIPEFAEPLLERFGITSDQYYRLFFSVVWGGLIVSLILRIRDGAPAGLDDHDREQWRMMNWVLLIASTLLGGGITFAWLF